MVIDATHASSLVRFAAAPSSFADIAEARTAVSETGKGGQDEGVPARVIRRHEDAALRFGRRYAARVRKDERPQDLERAGALQNAVADQKHLVGGFFVASRLALVPASAAVRVVHPRSGNGNVKVL